LSYAELDDTDLRRAKIEYSDLRNAFLRRANLKRTNLSNSDLEGAKLNHANLSKANLMDTILENAVLEEVKFDEAWLADADLAGANLRRAHLESAILIDTSLENAVLEEANLFEANFSKANLAGANLRGAYLELAHLRGAILTKTDLTGAFLQSVDLRDADLSNSTIVRANLDSAILVNTNLSGATIIDSKIYGISAWNVNLKNVRKQANLRVTPTEEPAVYVDNIEVAQFVYLLLHNEKIRSVIDTIGEKGALILGRFTKERKPVLDAIRNKLRELGFVPMMFDFEKPTQRDFTETIKTLAGISRFIIADITNPKSAPLELQATMPDYMIPFVPIIHEGEEPFSMFRDLKQKYGEWVLDVLEYDSAESLIDVMADAIVQPALNKAYELIDRKSEALKKRHVRDYKRKP
jgi:uncharacterized protein YjbI with pentapeptide repeats